MTPPPGSTSASSIASAFRERFGRSPDVIVRAPGRVNLLGAHVDYNDGFVLPAAIDRAVWLAAGRAHGASGRLCALDLGADVAFEPPVEKPQSNDSRRWADYPLGVAWVLRGLGHEVGPIDAVFGGDLPMGAGVSSSAAVEVAFFLAFEALGGFALEGRERARLGRRVENEVLGVGSGVMDQFASIHGRAGHAVLLDCRSLEHELIPVPEEVAVLVADTGVRRALVGSAFNDRRAECRQAVELLRAELPGITALRDVSPEELDRHAGLLPPSLQRRARHVVEECARVLAGAERLRAGQMEELGELVRASHRSSRDLYEVSIAELDLLAETAWTVPGCYGARLTGAGFGGCVTAAVQRDALDELERTLRAAFRARFGRDPSMLRCRIADGAAVVG
jgi:galactokinase